MRNKFGFGFVLVVFLAFFSCRDSYKPHVAEEIVDQMTYPIAKQLYEQKELYQIGSGGRIANDVEKLSLSFMFYHEVNEEQARELLLSASQEYLSAINNNEKLQPYLYHRPFKIEDIEISVFFLKPDRSEVPPPDIYVAEVRDGMFVYKVDDLQNNTLKTVLKETYEEALKNNAG